MMKNPHPAHNRMTALSVALGLIMLLFIAALYSAQILNGSENRARSIASNATWQSVEASRGILTDRNGKVLVSNRLAYTLTFSKKSFSDEQELNAARRRPRGWTRCPCPRMHRICIWRPARMTPSRAF